jgi:hypothetical protein
VQNWLTNALKKRVIKELRKILYDHPRYRADSNNVQNKYAFEERPQRGIIVNDASADRVRLSADNYMGRITSFVMQTPVENKPGTTLEWVRENTFYLEQFSLKRDIFPSPPGVYILEVTKLPNIGRQIPGEFTLEPILTQKNEPLIQFTATDITEAQLAREDIYPNSVQLWLDSRHLLLEGVDYTVDYSTGAVTFLKETPVNSDVFADYRYIIDKQGPFYFHEETAHFTAIPGAILAFGDRAQNCDKIAIVVTEDRTEVADVFGGKFEVNFSLIVFAQDPEEREKLSDYIVIKFLEKQNYLGFEGLELIDISPGGESEEVYNPEIDDYYYDGAISLSMRVDWEVYAPLPVVISRAEPISKTEEQQKGFMDGSYTWDQLVAVSDPTQIFGMSLVLGKDIGYERIS